MAASHGARSSSVKGTLALILAILAAGCRSSPSANVSPRCAASAWPSVVLPEPGGPMITTTGCARGGMLDPRLAHVVGEIVLRRVLFGGAGADAGDHLTQACVVD